MSFDLLIFDPALVQYQDQAEFMVWYDEFTGWSGSHDYSDAGVVSPKLKSLYDEMSATYPPINGPDAVDADFDNSKLTEYSFGPEAIYMGFAWSETAGAFEEVTRLAAKHELGFFNVSSDVADVWLPDGEGGMTRIY